MNTATESKTVNAYYVRAEVKGESWKLKGGTFAAATEAEAIEKATKVMELTEAHQITAQHVTVYSTTAKIQTDNYPYGRLRSKAFFSVEYNKKGSRSVFQTINPKNGRLNAPKNSTYSVVILPCINHSTGHIDFCGYLDFNGSESINQGLQFMADFHELFTEEQAKNVALSVIAMLKVHTKAMCIYSGSDFEALKPLIEGQIKTAVEIAKTGANLWAGVKLDTKAIDATKKPDFNPFKVTEYKTA